MKIIIFAVLLVLIAGAYYLYVNLQSRQGWISDLYPWQAPALQGSNQVPEKDYMTSSAPEIAVAAPSRVIRVMSPNGGDRWAINKQYVINWTHTDRLKTLRYNRTTVELVSRLGTELQFRKAVGQFGQSILDAPTSLQWVVTPDVPDRNDYYVLVTYETSDLPDFGGVVFKGLRYQDISDRPFSITTASSLPAELKLVNPNGGQKFKVGEKYRITWQGRKLSLPVVVEIWRGDEKVARIGSALGAYNSYYDWTIGKSPGEEDVSYSGDYRVRIGTYEAEGFNQLEDFSDTVFSISP